MLILLYQRYINRPTTEIDRCRGRSPVICVIQISQQRGTELYHECYLLTVRTTQACSIAIPGDKTLVKCIKKITLDHSLMIN